MTAVRQSGEVATASRILDIAERLVQTHGFNAFSYADIAAELTISKASLHYHFRAKSDLGEALISRYSTRFAHALRDIDGRGGQASAKLAAYAGIYADVLRQRRMCLCGMLAADYETLPPPMRQALVTFFADNEAWVAGVLRQGEQEGSVRLTGPAGEVAHVMVSGLEGLMLVTRPLGDVGRFQAAATRLLRSLAAPQEYLRRSAWPLPDC